jgi:L-asparaginase
MLCTAGGRNEIRWFISVGALVYFKIMKNIWVITTGGTIEKTYSEDEGFLENRESVLRDKFLNKLRLPDLKISVLGLMAKDSLLMTDEDREKISTAISSLAPKSQALVVLHGTDTLDKTLLYCHEKIKEPSVPVVFTGAMKPAGFDDSDALQNFTEALLASRILPTGYYLSFHGQVFEGPIVRKNKEKRTFEGDLFKF